MNTESTDAEVIIVGGGPAGSTAACLLAQHGRKVLLLEKEKFPRYHVGESLMPHTYSTFERLGVVEKLNALGFVRKYSVQFANRAGRISTPFYFHKYHDHPSSVTWQVTRADFDQMLLENAREKGADVREETAVTDFIRNEQGAVAGVRARGKDGAERAYRARLVIDATGRDALFLRKTGSRQRDPQLDKVAVWTRYKGAKRDPGIDEGATTIAYLDNKGWFWNIPLQDDVLSLGIVAERDYLFGETRDPAEIFRRELEKNAWITDHFRGATQFGEYWTTGEYSYRGAHCAADGLVMIGDAFAFLDPVFSSGVMLALKSGEMAADTVHAALARTGPITADVFADYGRRLCAGIETMRQVVYAFYDPRFSFADVIRGYPHLHSQLTDCLMGKIVDQDYTELLAAIAQYATLPAPLAHGHPAVTPAQR